MDKTTFERAVTLSGNSLVIKMTKEVTMMGLKKGDIVKVTLEKVE